MVIKQMFVLWRQSFTRILLLALFARTAWALLVPVIPVSDSNAYDTFARNLAGGFGYCWEPGSFTAYWPVGTPFVYAMFYAVFGHTYIPIVVFNIILGLTTVLFSMLLAERWFNKTVAIITGLLLALWPSQIEFTTVLASELLFVALIVITLWVWSSPGIGFWAKAVLLGVLLAAATYVRPIALLIPPLLAVLTMAKEKRLGRPLAAGPVELLVIGALILPWTIRNVRVFGSFVLTTTSGGVNLWMGNNPDSGGGYMPYPEYLSREMNEAQIDEHLGAIAKSYIRQYPGRFIARTLVKLIQLHDRETIGVHWNASGLTQRFSTRALLPLKIVSNGFWLLALAFSLIGIIVLFLSRGFLATIIHPLVVLWAYFASLHAVIVVGDRYHFPSIPMIAMLAAFAIAACVHYARRPEPDPAKDRRAPLSPSASLLGSERRKE